MIFIFVIFAIEIRWPNIFIICSWMLDPVLPMLTYDSPLPSGLGNAACLVWMEGDAEALTLKDESVDGYSIAFGIRNVTHIDRALKEAYRYVFYLYENTLFVYFCLLDLTLS